MTMETKLNYKVTFEEAYISTLYFNIYFIVDEKEYRANCFYYNGSEMEDINIQDENGNDVDEENPIYQLGYELLCDMELTKENLAW